MNVIVQLMEIVHLVHFCLHNKDIIIYYKFD